MSNGGNLAHNIIERHKPGRKGEESGRLDSPTIRENHRTLLHRFASRNEAVGAGRSAAKGRISTQHQKSIGSRLFWCWVTE